MTVSRVLTAPERVARPTAARVREAIQRRDACAPVVEIRDASAAPTDMLVGV